MRPTVDVTRLTCTDHFAKSILVGELSGPLQLGTFCWSRLPLGCAAFATVEKTAKLRGIESAESADVPAIGNRPSGAAASSKQNLGGPQFAALVRSPQECEPRGLLARHNCGHVCCQAGTGSWRIHQ